MSPFHQRFFGRLLQQRAEVIYPNVYERLVAEVVVADTPNVEFRVQQRAHEDKFGQRHCERINVYVDGIPKLHIIGVGCHCSENLCDVFIHGESEDSEITAPYHVVPYVVSAYLFEGAAGAHEAESFYLGMEFDELD